MKNSLTLQPVTRPAKNFVAPTGRARQLLFWVILVLWGLALVEASTAGYFLFKLSKTYYRPLYFETRNDQWLWRTEHHAWGGWHRPSSTANHTHHCFSVSYRSNSYGARDRERSPTETSRRAVILGDSFIEGYAVEEDRRLSNLLEQHLGLEILNFGMTHFGPLQYHILYEKLARQFDHDLVIIGFLPNNDFIDNDADVQRRYQDFPRQYRPYYAEDGGVFYPRSPPTPDEPAVFAELATDLRERRPWPENLRRLSWLYGLYREIRFNVVALHDPTPSDYIGYFETNTVRISRATESILAIQKAAAPRQVLVVFIPDYRSWSYVDRHPGSYDKSIVVGLQATLERNGIRTIDLLKAFMSRGLQKESLYLSCDGHWNEAGNWAAFDVIHPVVRELLQSPGVSG
jgi:hypothetical protein